MNKKKFASAMQKHRLIHLVESDPQLRSGKFSSSFTPNDAKKRWLRIAKDLNSITGAKKTWMEWRKTWQDRKANAKKKSKKVALLRKQAILTGYGPPPNPLEETSFINAFDQPPLLDHNDSKESIATFIDVSYGLNLDENSPSKIDLASAKWEESLNDEDAATSKIDLSIPGTSNDEDATPEIDLSETEKYHTEDGKVRQGKLPKFKSKYHPNETACRNRFAQKRFQDELNVVQALNKTLQERNAIKKRFYEDYITLMARKVKALEDVANALNKDS